MPLSPAHWRPTTIVRYIEGLGTSTNVMRVETDAGEGFIKTLGNPEGPHALASEWVGTRLADLLAIPTLDYAIITVGHGIELPMRDGGNALPGPAFISKLDHGLPWGGGAKQLASVVNRRDLARLVVLDTWIRNRDRYCVGASERRNPDNVWLSRRGQTGRKVLATAIDHTHCFGDTLQFTSALANISVVQDERVFGLFPEFEPYLRQADLQSACDMLSTVTVEQLSPLIESVPEEWELSAPVRAAWLDFLVRRAAHVAKSLMAQVFR